MGPRGNPVASRLLKEADVIVALGTRLGFNSTFYSYDNINPDADIIQIEIEPTAIGRFFPVAVGIWSDARDAAVKLATAVETQEAKAEVEAWSSAFIDERTLYLDQRNDDAIDTDPVQPSGLFKVFRDVFPHNAAITLDAGTMCLQATDALEYHSPAQPERPVISLMGDGGFGMTISELSTAVAYDLNTVTVVMNNQCWGAEKAYQRDFFGERYLGADISSPPFDKVAELYGAAGFRAESLADVGGAIEAALDCGRPAVVDIAVDPDALYSFRRDSFAHREEIT